MNKRNSSAYNRDASIRKALRKRRIAEEVYYNGKENPYYKPPGRKDGLPAVRELRAPHKPCGLRPSFSRCRYRCGSPP